MLGVIKKMRDPISQKKTVAPNLPNEVTKHLVKRRIIKRSWMISVACKP